MAPIYEFQCLCGLCFEASCSMKNATKPSKCPSCSEMAPRKMPSELVGVFNQSVSGPVPQNTGVSQLDAHIDRVIGQSAKQGWETHRKRVKEKQDILREHPDVTGHDLSRNLDGTYRILASEEKGMHDRAMAINSKAMTELQQRRADPLSLTDEGAAD